MAGVSFEGVWKWFGDIVAVRDLNLEIQDGEFLVLVGPSGSGKSTILRLLAGLETVSRGEIRIGGRRVNEVPPKDRDIAMVFQSYALYPHMSVFENLAFGLSLRQVPKAQIRRRVLEAARLLDIRELLNRRPKQLSGGQRQRVALGRAIVRDPKVFLLDEPLSNLDAKLRVQTRAELSKLHRRLATTFVYVTHDQAEAMTMASRIAVLDLGELQQVGTPQELYEQPANLFVAGFIGSPAMNFFTARVEAGGGDADRPALLGEGFRLPVPPARLAALADYRGKEVVIGIRPENIHDPEYTPADIPGASLSAEIEVTEFMGNEIFVHFRSEAGRFLARVDHRSTIRPGQTAVLVLDISRLHAFDPATGEAIR